MRSIIHSLISVGMDFPIRSFLFLLINIIAINHNNIPIIIEVIASRSGFFVRYEAINPIVAIKTPITAMVSSYTTANVIGSACSKISFRFLWVEDFLISLTAIPRVIDSMTNDIAKMINVRWLICTSPGDISIMTP